LPERHAGEAGGGHAGAMREERCGAGGRDRGVDERGSSCCGQREDEVVAGEAGATRCGPIGFGRSDSWSFGQRVLAFAERICRNGVDVRGIDGHLPDGDVAGKDAVEPVERVPFAGSAPTQSQRGVVSRENSVAARKVVTEWSHGLREAGQREQGRRVPADAEGMRESRRCRGRIGRGAAEGIPEFRHIAGIYGVSSVAGANWTASMLATERERGPVAGIATLLAGG